MEICVSRREKRAPPSRIPLTALAVALVSTACSSGAGVAAPGPGPASPPPAAAGALTIWDGVYTAAQAGRGEEIAEEFCVTCHSASDWYHEAFLNPWMDRPLRALYVRIQNTMPRNAPGSLSDDDYSAVVAHMLALNLAPVGPGALPSDVAGLRAITITRRDDR